MRALSPYILAVEGGCRDADRVPDCLCCGACEEEVRSVLGGANTQGAVVVVDDILASELLSSVKPVECE
jgi:hypothetical protein